jgi:dihydrofolate synthase/folylpolyglutamate synthase
MEVFRRTAAEKNAPLMVVDDISNPVEETLPPIRLQTIGFHQPGNARLAATCLLELHRRGRVSIQPGLLSRGLSHTRLPGRGQVLTLTGPDTTVTIVVDGAHTPESVASLTRACSGILPAGWIVLFGAVRGKAVREMTAILAPHTRAVVVTPPGSFKPSDPVEILRSWRSGSDPAPAVYAAHPLVALDAALKYAVRAGGAPIVVTGSFYLVAVILRAVIRYAHEHRYAISGFGR